MKLEEDSRNSIIFGLLSKLQQQLKQQRPHLKLQQQLKQQRPHLKLQQQLKQQRPHLKLQQQLKQQRPHLVSASRDMHRLQQDYLPSHSSQVCVPRFVIFSY
ncbi:unnamed protein product [Fasciola hepatica]|uniref:Uncharacterized protein n=1 Tax=Fasciola hepatica TaxID=6192 RepID=A0ABC9HIR0_FASHE